MLLGRKFDDLWDDYCKMCEWNGRCDDDKVCPYFTPRDLIDFEIGEVLCDQAMRQAEYLKIMAEFGGEC